MIPNFCPESHHPDSGEVRPTNEIIRGPINILMDELLKKIKFYSVLQNGEFYFNIKYIEEQFLIGDGQEIGKCFPVTAFKDIYEPLKDVCGKTFDFIEGLDEIFEHTPILFVTEEMINDKDLLIFNGSSIKVPSNKYITRYTYNPESNKIVEKANGMTSLHEAIALYQPKTKRIFVWVDLLYKIVYRKELSFKLCLMQIILHELSHAYMDMKHDITDKGLSYFKEESLAEGLSLFLFKHLNIINDDTRKQIEYFSSAADIPYQLGVFYQDEDLLRVALPAWRKAKGEDLQVDEEWQSRWLDVITNYPFIDNKKLRSLEKDFKKLTEE